MALTQISTGGVKDDAVTAGKIPAGAVGSSEIAKPIDLADNEKVRLGTGNDLEIYHDGSNSKINNGTGTFSISNASSEIQINKGTSEYMGRFITDGAVELYYNNTKKIETLTNGAKVSGSLYVENAGTFLKSNQLDFYPSGTAFIDHAVTGQSLSIRVSNSSSMDTTALTIASTGAATFSNSVSDSKGDVRKIIQNTQGSTYTLVAADAGKHILASGTVTIPNSVFAAGDAVTIVNNTAGDLTLTASVGTLYNTADAATGNRTLATRGMATILFASATVAYISGAGLS